MTFRIIPDESKTVLNYFGYDIPYDNVKYKWVATDKNGDICYYSYKPEIKGDIWKESGDKKGFLYYLDNVSYDGDWKESLIEIEGLL